MQASSKSQPIFNIPNPVGSLIGFTILVHVALMFLSENAARTLYYYLVFFPGRTLADNAFLSDPVGFVISPVGYALLHVDWVHLLVNMGWLLAFGSAVARRMSPVWFLVFYMLGALSGSLTMLAVYGGSSGPIIGASAAVAAVSGALVSLSLWPKPNRPPPPRPFHIRSTALGFVAIYLVMNILFGAVPSEVFNTTGRIAWEAHLGGFGVGILLMPFFDGKGLYR